MLFLNEIFKLLYFIYTVGDFVRNIGAIKRRNKDFRETFKGPIADWYEKLKAEVPTKEDILVKKDTIKIYNRAGDPATTESYEGGDDVHEKVGGWDTENDALGGVKVE